METLAGRIMLLSGWRRWLLAVFAGLVAVLALPPLGFFASAFLSFTVLVWLIDGATGDPDAGLLRRLWPAFCLGWGFGLGYFLGGLWWLGNALLVEAEDFAWAVPLAVVGLPMVLAIYHGLACAIARLLWSSGPGRIAALAVSFGLFEWLRGVLFTGFPWNSIAYLAMPMPLMMQSASVLGLTSITMLAVIVFSAPALLGTRQGKRRGIAMAVVLLVAHLGFGAYRLTAMEPRASEPPLALRLVQPDIDQSRKIDDGERRAIFEEHLSLTALAPADGAPRPDVVVWPETSIPFILTENPDALQRIADVLEPGQTLIAGAVRTEDAGAGLPPRYYNSIYVVDDTGQITGAADKMHLVPFGEYLPFSNLLSSFGLDAIAARMPGGFSAAATRPLLSLPSGRSFYPLICYEAIFPGEIGDDVQQTAAVLNVTNDTWFGNTPGPAQHFYQARLRAVETGIPLVRSANSGISAVLDTRGRVVDGLEYGEKGVVDTLLPGRSGSLASFRTRETIDFLIWLSMFGVATISRFGLIRRIN